MGTKSEMTSSALVELLRLLDEASIAVWLDGGWGVDALLKTQTRPHKDVDIILRVSDVPELREMLGRRGFAIKEGSPPNSSVLANGSGLEVDVHAVVFDEDDNGVYGMENGEDAASLTGGGIQRAGRCRKQACELPVTDDAGALPRPRVCADGEGLPRYGTPAGTLRR